MSFAQPIILTFLIENENIKINSKIINVKKAKKRKMQFSYTCLCHVVCYVYVYVCAYYFFKSALSSRRENTGPVTVLS